MIDEPPDMPLSLEEYTLLPLTSPADQPKSQAFQDNRELVKEYQELAASGEAPHGYRPPNLACTFEKPEHRLLLYLKAQGYSNREVAQKTGYTEAWVSQITRQPWFLKRLLTEVRAAGREGLQKFMQVQAEESLYKVVQLRETAKSEVVQLGAAINLLDRFFGKPIQRTEVKMETTQVTKKYENLQAELADLEAQERELLAKTKT